MQSDNSMYRLAMRATVVMAIGSALLLLAHVTFPFISPRVVRMLLFGVAFWLVMFYGYWADWREREKDMEPTEAERKPPGSKDGRGRV